MKKFFSWVVKNKWKILIVLGSILLTLGLAFGVFLFAAPRAGTFVLEAPEDAIFEADVSGEQVLLLSREEPLSLNAVIQKDNGKSRRLGPLERRFLTYESSDDWFVEVDKAGGLHVNKDGYANVTARYFKHEVSLRVHAYTPLDTIRPEEEAYETAIGETVQVNFIKMPQTAYLLSQPEYTIEDPGIASVDEQGLVTGLRKGKTTVRIRVEDQECTAPLRVFVPLESISFPEEDIRIMKYRHVRLEPIWAPADADIPEDLTYISSNENIVTVSEEGELTAVNPGKALITVKGGECKTTLYVEVYSPMRGISLDKEKIELVGREDTEQLTVLFTPEDTTDPRTLGWWSSDESVAVVDQDGKVTSTGPGKCVIHVRCGTYYAECPVEVRIPMEGIQFSFEKLTIHYGDTVVFPLYYLPEDTTDDRTATWESSNPAAAIVDENGAVTAVGAGETTITAKVGDFTASVAVTADIPVTGVAISQGALTLNKGQGAQLSASVLPANTTEEPYITWSSDNVKVATVSSTGAVTAVGAGTCTITANHDLVGATCVVTVLSPMTGMRMDQPTLSVIERFTAKLSVSLEPADTTDRPGITWKSDNTRVATVDAEGKVKGVKAGTCHITASAGRFSTSATITVLPYVEVTSITLSRSSLTLQKSGDTATLTATIRPSNASVNSASWSSSNSKVATVDGKGKVTAKGSGTCTITAQAGNKKASCTVTVLAANKVVVLDPGHCNAFPGASYFGIQEAEINLKTAQYCKSYLESHYNGVTVYMTRTNGANLGPTLAADLEARAQFAQDKGADILVSLHYNATPAHNASGCLVFVSYQPNVASKCQALGNQILARISALGLKNLGCISTASDQYFDPYGNPLDYYAINRHSANRGIPGIIVEHCFMDTDVSFCNSDAALKRMGTADAQGIAAYLGLSSK